MEGARRPAGVPVFTRYRDVQRVLRDFTTFSSQRLIGASPKGPGYPFMLFCQDPPLHSRLRGCIQRAFTSRSLEPARQVTERETNLFLDGLKPAGETVDIAQGLALPLPILVILKLLGVSREHGAQLKGWTEAAVGHHHQGTQCEARKAFMLMHAFFRQRITMETREGARGIIDDLLRYRESGVLGDSEVINFCVTLLIAGNETTSSLISNLLYQLAHRPDLWRSLRADQSLVAQAIEETLRFDSPVQFVSRIVSEPVTLGGRLLTPGERIVAGIGPANRDPEIFAQPDLFLPARPEKRHLAFSHGIHFCVGAALSRLETETVLYGLLKRYRSITLDGHGSRYRNLNFRGFQNLNLTLAR